MSPNEARAVLAATLVAIVAIVASGCGGADKAGGERKADAIELTLANGNDDSRNLDPFAAAVERLSGGSLRITFRNSWRAGESDYEEGVIRDVAAGKADLGWAGSRAFDDVGVQSFDALHAPLLLDSYPLQRKVLESPLAGEMLDGLEPLGLVGLGILPGPMRKPLGTARLVGPDDYEGATIAYQRSEVAKDTLHALGAEGREIPSAGSISPYDGVEQHLGSIAGNQYEKGANHLAADVNLWPRPVVVFADKQALDKLDDRQRKALRDAAQAALPASLAQVQADDREGAGTLCRRGVEFLTADDTELAALRRAVQPVYDRLEQDAQTKSAIRQILALRSKAPTPPDAPSCVREAAAASPGKPTTIDGVYRSDITPKQLDSTPGAESDEAGHPSNVGHFRLELQEGRYRVSGSADGVDQEGTFSLDGDVLTFHNWNNEGDFAYKWSVYRGALTLRKTIGGPTIFAVHPWKRVGDPTSVGERTPIDGVYALKTTREESNSPGESVSEIFSENYGRWRFVFDRGLLRYTQASEGARRWTTATYAVRGRTLTIEITDYGGEAPNGAAEKPGEVFTYGWSLYRDRLTLEAVEGKISPTGWMVRPLRRVGDAPRR